ncbi:MAG: cbb3-type cytochrome c oxidase subunit I, partial [Candidatus Hydrothermarchaeaceae archaeon]
VIDGAYLFNFGTRIITAHAHLALLGWVSLIVMGAMSWMLPMTVMRDLENPKLLDLVFWLFNIGTVGFFAGIVAQGFGGVAKAFALIVGLSVAAFAYLMLRTAMRNVKMQMTAKSTEGKFFKAAIVYFVASCAFGILMLFGKGGIVPGVKILHVHIALIGFVSVTIFGGMYHIIPMICWTRTVEKLAGGKGTMPSSFKDLYSDRLATVIFALLNIGIVGFFFGFVMALHPLAVASAVSITAAGVIFAFDMMRVIAKS